MEIDDLPARYIYEGKSFCGGQATVLLCRDTFLERQVAIKIYTYDDQAEFDTEVQLIKDIESQHIAQLYDLIPSPNDNKSGLVQEFVSGDCLADVNLSDTDTEYFLKILFQIATAIADLHNLSIIHRDIKPHNMRFDIEGIVKLLDFGFSCTLQDDPETLYARGTHGFRAPELFDPPTAVTPALDVYAYGATAWYLASQTLPDALLELPPQETLTPDSIGTIRPDLPGQVIGLLDCCLLQDPGKRPDISVIRECLERHLLFGKHRAELAGHKVYTLSEPGKAVRIKISDECQLSVTYDGLTFFVSSVVGNVYINNQEATEFQRIPNSCVITLGHPGAGSDRLFVPFNVSHPEVVL